MGGLKSESMIVDSEEADCVELWLLLLPFLLPAPLMEAEAEVFMADSLVKGCQGADVGECGAAGFAPATGPRSLNGVDQTGPVSWQAVSMSGPDVSAERHNYCLPRLIVRNRKVSPACQVRSNKSLVLIYEMRIFKIMKLAAT